MFARFIVFHSLPAFFLSVILDFAIKAVFPVPVAIVSTSGMISVAALACSLCMVAIPALESVVLFVLEGRDLVFGVFLIFVLRLTVILVRRNWF